MRKEDIPNKTEVKSQLANEKINLYFNIDNETGRIREVNLQKNEAARDMMTKGFAQISMLKNYL